MPANPVGDAAVRALRAEGVRVDHVVRGGSRLGVYFAETGASQRASTVVYDRAHSAISELTPGVVPWASVLAGADWFHCTGITPALGADAAARHARSAGGRSAGRRARQRRSQLPQQAVVANRRRRRVMRPLMPLVDVVIANEEDLQAVLGIEVPHADVTGGVARSRRLPHGRRSKWRRSSASRQVAVTLRESLSASDNAWSAVLLDGDTGQFHRSQRYDVRLVDRIGGGDSFAAGLIFGLAIGQRSGTRARASRWRPAR